MNDIIDEIKSLKYKRDEQIMVWKINSAKLEKDRKREIFEELMSDNVFGYLDVISEIIYELLEISPDFIILLESFFEKIKNDLAAGPFYEMIIKIGNTADSPIKLFELIQTDSKNSNLKIISGLIIGGLGKKEEAEALSYINERLKKPKTELIHAFIRSIMVIFKDRILSDQACRLLEKIFKYGDSEVYPDYMNLSTDLFNLNPGFFLPKIRKMLEKKSDNINYVFFKNLAYQDLEISDNDIISFIESSKDSSDYVLDEILYVIKKKNIFNESIGNLLIYWINEELRSRNFEWVLEELSKNNSAVIKFFFRKFHEINLFEVKFPHILESFIKSSPSSVIKEATMMKISEYKEGLFIVRILETVIGFIYKSDKYYRELTLILDYLREVIKNRDYIDKDILEWLDKNDLQKNYDVCVDKIDELINQLLNRQRTYDYPKIISNISKYNTVFSYSKEIIEECKKNKEYSPILWLGEREDPELDKQKLSESASEIERALSQSYVRSQYWPKAYLNDLEDSLKLINLVKNERYSHLSPKAYKKIVSDSLKQEKSFWDYYSELNILLRFHNAGILKKIEPSKGQNQLDALINLNNKDIYLEITNPQMDRKLKLDFGAVALGNKSLPLIQRKLQQAYKVLTEKDYFILAIDISTSSIDEYNILNSLYGSLGITLQFDDQGQFVRNFPSRSADSIAKKFKNHSMLSGIIIFKRSLIFREKSPIIALHGDIYLNPHAKNKLSEEDLKKLKEITFNY